MGGFYSLPAATARQFGNESPMKITIMCIGAMLALILAGCTSSSGVVSTGPETYMIARTQKGARGASGPVLAAAMEEAGEYCKKLGRVMKVVSVEKKDMVPFKSDAQATVYFMALDPHDPRLKEETK